MLVNIKWGKEKFQDVEVNTNESPEVFQAQLFALSGVPPERQKIMAKGKTLKVSKSYIRHKYTNLTFIFTINSTIIFCQASQQASKHGMP